MRYGKNILSGYSVDMFCFAFSGLFCTFAYQIRYMNSLKHRFMMNRLGRRLYHCLMFYAS